VESVEVVINTTGYGNYSSKKLETVAPVGLEPGSGCTYVRGRMLKFRRIATHPPRRAEIGHCWALESCEASGCGGWYVSTCT